MLVLAAALTLVWPRLRSYATLAASYGAHVACTCHYIGGRPLKDCRHDFERGMGVVTLSADEPARRITARYLFLARQSATLADGAGCLLEPWRG
ncbi:MAG: hypothetical protein JF593_04480 [Novosphingobium sp.]|nr:hypothetical protein [Novosphingobium sp.]